MRLNKSINTNRDLKFETDFTKKISESMTSENLITAPEGITLDEAKKILAKARKRFTQSGAKLMNFYLNRNIKWSCGKCNLPWLFLHKYGCINVFLENIM